MKIIDLLNKIANGEEVPEKIKIETHIFTRFDYSKGDGTYISSYQSDDGQYYIQDYSYPKYLNREVEIIEEHKEEPQEHKIPEKIDQWDRKWHYTYYKKEQLNQMRDNIEHLRQKYNKIIDYLEVNND